MLDVAANYPGANKYKASGWMCKACNLKVKEDQEHLTVCRGYEDLRLDADLNRENELVDFFTRVMERRKENKWDQAAGRRCTAARLGSRCSQIVTMSTI